MKLVKNLQGTCTIHFKISDVFREVNSVICVSNIYCTQKLNKICIIQLKYIYENLRMYFSIKYTA